MGFLNIFHKCNNNSLKKEDDYGEGSTYFTVKCLINGECEIMMKCNWEEKRIHIHDFKPENSCKAPKFINKGYGSEMMKKLLEYANENGCEEIFGELSVVDLDHKDRLHHFYEKFGFKIMEYSQRRGCYYGEIKKML